LSSDSPLDVPVDGLAQHSLDEEGTVSESLTTPTMAPEASIIRLPRNGPKPGQSLQAWLYGKDKGFQQALDRQAWQSSSRSSKAC